MTPRVCTWGTFDCLHDGHKKFLTNASKYGKLYVIVVPSHIKLENNGYLPIKDESERKNDLIHFGKVINNNIIENVYIDCYENGLESMLSIRPDIICFGYDQSNYWKNKLIQFLNNNKINPQIKILPKYNNGKHSSHINNYQINRIS